MGIIEKRVLKDGSFRYDARIHRRKGMGTKNGALSKTFKKEAEAKAWMHGIETKIDNRGNISRTAETLTFADAAAAYIAEARATTSQAKAKALAAKATAAKTKPTSDVEADAASPSNVSPGERQAIAAIVHDMGNFHIADITNSRIQGWIDQFLRTPIPFQERKKVHPYFDGGLDKQGKPKLYSESTVRRHFFVLKKVLTWTAVKNRFHLDPNLFLLLEVPRAWAGKRDRRFEDGEEAKIRDALARGYVKHKEWTHLLDFTLATAARMQEILKAEWKDISYKREAWDIPETNVKTSVFRQVPLSEVAIAALKGMEAFKVEGESRVFHPWKDSSTLSKAWRRVVKRAGVDDFHFHDLRHEGVSRLFENTDLSDTEIMTITGHTSQEMLKAYAKLRPNSLAARLNGKKKG